MAHQHKFRTHTGEAKVCDLMTHDQVRCPACGVLVGYRDYRRPAVKGVPAEIFCSMECANKVPCYEELRAHLDGRIKWLDETPRTWELGVPR